MLSAAVIAAFTLAGTGCATKKYVAKTVDPVEKRVSGTESKNTDQDKELATHAGQIQELDKDLSLNKERLGDVDAKATAAGAAAKQAGERAEGAMTAANGAQTSANGAQTSANNARSFAEQGLTQMGKTVEAMNKFQLLKAESVLFPVNQAKLEKDGKEQLADLAKMTNGLDRFIVEVQGFTDKTGSPALNEALSAQRAQEVARYLVNEHKIPVRSVTTLGSGYAAPVADDKTREGRKLNRRVEVRLYVPEANASGNKLTAQND
jgi:outer membrane protein OmpA-like peptidoglycan-associated protein